MMKRIFLSLGTNMGHREQNLIDALHNIGNQVGNQGLVSPVYETEPWGFETDHNFLNMAVEVFTVLAPHQVLEQCLAIEQSLGRVRQPGMGAYTSRIIDIDVLFYEKELINDEQLVLPHPHLHKRRFILEPLCSIAPDFVHPLLGQSIQQLLNKCTDACRVSIRGAIDFQ